MMTKIKSPRQDAVTDLIARDGLACQHPSCGEPIDLTAEGKLQATVDHWYPQSWCHENGWTYEQVWDLSNLKLMHRKCNASKGNLIPNEDGTLPPKHRKEFRYRRQKRANRPEVCVPCQSGRNLGPDEICAACGSGPQPYRWPRWAKVPSKECLHDGTFWCWACASGVVERPSAVEMIMVHGEGGDED